MTDRARELLERAYYVLGELSYAILKDSGEYNLAGDIYEFLAESEVKREALSDEEMSKGFIWYGPKHQVNQYEIFKLGVRFAEKHHGIGGGE